MELMQNKLFSFCFSSFFVYKKPACLPVFLLQLIEKRIYLLTGHPVPILVLTALD